MLPPPMLPPPMLPPPPELRPPPPPPPPPMPPPPPPPPPRDPPPPPCAPPPPPPPRCGMDPNARESLAMKATAAIARAIFRGLMGRLREEMSCFSSKVSAAHDLRERSSKTLRVPSRYEHSRITTKRLVRPRGQVVSLTTGTDHSRGELEQLGNRLRAGARGARQ